MRIILGNGKNSFIDQEAETNMRMEKESMWLEYRNG